MTNDTTRMIYIINKRPKRKTFELSVVFKDIYQSIYIFVKSIQSEKVTVTLNPRNSGFFLFPDLFEFCKPETYTDTHYDSQNCWFRDFKILPDITNMWSSQLQLRLCHVANSEYSET